MAVVTSNDASYSEKLNGIIRESDKIFAKDMTYQDGAPEKHDWMSISHMFDFFDQVELFHETLQNFIKQYKDANKVEPDAAWKIAQLAGRELYNELYDVALKSTRELLSDPMAAERFSEWILENRRYTNKWIFTCISELISMTRGNKRFKLLRVVEDKKDNVLGSPRIPLNTDSPITRMPAIHMDNLIQPIIRTGAHSIISRCGLVPTRSMTAREAFQYIHADYHEATFEKNIKRVVAEKQRGILFIDLSGAGTAIDFDLSGIISPNADPPEGTRGLNKQVIDFFDTVRVLPVIDIRTPRENIIARSGTNEWYVLETINGELYRWGLYLGEPVIPVSRILSVIKSQPTRAEKYQWLMGEEILRIAINPFSTTMMRAYEDNIIQMASGVGVASSIEDAIYFALSRDVRSAKATTYDGLMHIVRDEEFLSRVIMKELDKVAGPTNSPEPELGLPRMYRHQNTVDVFLRTYDDRWRKDKYDPDSYDGSPASIDLFLGFLKILVSSTVADMTKNSFWDSFLIGPKEFWMRSL